MPEQLDYMSGFHNHFATEALPGALPQGQNSPQRCAYGLYAEQLTGSAFTAPRHQNFRSWLYRIRPSVKQSAYRALPDKAVATSPLAKPAADPNQMRWDPAPLPAEPTDFVDGLLTIAVNGDAGTQAGCGVHVYAFSQDMTQRFFYNADGELLIVPQQGTLRLRTEMGELDVASGEIALIPRGIKFQVRLGEGVDAARGYVCENYGSPSSCRPRPHRRQRPGQPPRLPEPGGGLRGPGGRLRVGGQVLRALLGHRPGPLAPGRGGLARQRHPLQV